MTTHRITDIERAMFDKGFASTGIVARKTGMHRTTVARLMRQGALTGKKITNQNFVSLTSVREYMGDDAVEIFKLDDWSDVVPNQAADEESGAPARNGVAAPRKKTTKRKRKP